MFSKKSTVQAEAHFEEANKLFTQSKFYDALAAYNKCLCHAEPGSIEIPLAFAGRSEVYFTMKLYLKCMNNIFAAKEAGFGLPAEEALVIDYREKQCRQLMFESSSDPSDVLWNFLKLSYPADKKIPFIIDGLALRDNEKFGRHVVTTRDLYPGDVIAIEETSFNFLCPDAVYTKCFNCLNSNMLDLLPSSASVMFCSEKCKRIAYEKFHERDDLIIDSLCGNDLRQKMMRIITEALFATGNFDQLQSIFEHSTRETVFDFDLRNSNELMARKKILTCVSSLMPKTDCGISKHLRELLKVPEGVKKDFLVNFSTRIILNYMRNGAKFPGKGTNLPDGGMLLPFTAMLNHSCDPNVYATFVDNKCYIIVTMPIKADEQIYTSYRKGFMELAKDQRQADLLKTYEFNCECIACAKDYPMPYKLMKIDKAFVLPKFGHFGTNEALLNELSDNFKFIADHIRYHPCYETAAMLIRNKELIRTVSERASFPFDFTRKDV